MKEGLGVFLWKIAVALYLIANGVLGLTGGKIANKGDFHVIFSRMFSGDVLNVFVAVASVIALVAGIAVLLEMFNIRLSFLDSLILIIAVIWAVYIVIEIIGWITRARSENFWSILQMLAVHIMVFSSLLIASKKIG
jgi:hypothetical protein